MSEMKKRDSQRSRMVNEESAISNRKKSVHDATLDGGKSVIFENSVINSPCNI
jgi:hypothetical protein